MPYSHLHLPVRSVRRLSASLAIGVLLVGLGVYVLVGWLLGDETMVRVFRESVPMRMNSALEFILIGVSFIILALPPSRLQRPLVRVLAIPVTLAACGFLLEHAFNIDLGINFGNLHSEFYHDNLRPGLVSLNSSAAFALTGLALMGLVSRRGEQYKVPVIRVLAALIFAICFGNVLANSFHSGFAYQLESWNQMAAPTLLAFLAAGYNLWLLSSDVAQGEAVDPHKSYDTRITYAAVAILTSLALASGLCGFVVLKQYADETLQDKLQREAKAGASHLVDSIEQDLAQANNLAAQPEFGALLAMAEASADREAGAATLVQTAQKFVGMGLDRIAFYDASGAFVTAIGKPERTALPDRPLFEVPIAATGQDDTLQWSDGFFLKTRRPLMHNGVVVGSVIIQQSMAPMTQALFDIRFAMKTTDAVLCAHGQGDIIRCFPGRFSPQPLALPMYKNGKPTYPVVYALEGQSGVMPAINPYGIPILAAYTPVGSTGLGFVVRIESSELYGVVRQRIHVLLAMMVLLVAAGALMLRHQVQPLVRMLVASEKNAHAANDALLRDAERLSQVISTQDMIASASFDLDQILNKIVDQLGRLTGASGTVIELVEGDELYYRATGGSLVPVKGFRINLSNSLSGVCIRERDIINCPDVEADARVDRAATTRLNIQSMMVAPLIHDGETLGVLKIASDHKSAFGDAESHTLKLLSGLIGSAIGKQIDYDAKQKLLVERTHMAQHDMLTGLPNRALFIDRLSTAIVRSGRSDKGMALLFLDLDGFKQVNDTKGHRAGDEVLREFARRLQSAVRKSDVVSRLAGDEFTIILENLADPVENVRKLTQKLLATTEELFRLQSGDVFLSVSIGAVLSHRDVSSVDELIHKADEEMYRAKRAGKNRCCILGQTA